jgi:PIN domain nuclease of toxin-antitoxin system
LRLLLDTHVLLWWLADDRRLGARARALIGAADNTVYVSAAARGRYRSSALSEN